MDNIDQSQTNDPSAYRAPPEGSAAAPSDAGTPVSQDAAATTAPQQEPTGEPAQAAPAAETVVQVASVAATAVAGDLGAAVQAAETGLDNLLKSAENVNLAPVTGDPDFVRERLHAIETHALTWGGDIGAAIRNELGALMDHLGVPRPH